MKSRCVADGASPVRPGRQGHGEEPKRRKSERNAPKVSVISAQCERYAGVSLNCSRINWKRVKKKNITKQNITDSGWKVPDRSALVEQQHAERFSGHAHPPADLPRARGLEPGTSLKKEKVRHVFTLGLLSLFYADHFASEYLDGFVIRSVNCEVIEGHFEEMVGELEALDAEDVSHAMLRDGGRGRRHLTEGDEGEGKEREARHRYLSFYIFFVLHRPLLRL